MQAEANPADLSRNFGLVSTFKGNFLAMFGDGCIISLCKGHLLSHMGGSIKKEYQSSNTSESRFKDSCKRDLVQKFTIMQQNVNNLWMGAK